MKFSGDDGGRVTVLKRVCFVGYEEGEIFSIVVLGTICKTEHSMGKTINDFVKVVDFEDRVGGVEVLEN